MNAIAKPQQPDFTAIKERQQAMWSSGDFSVIGTTLQIVGERLAEAADVRAGEQVIDVAAGNGNATLAAARRFASVISTDYVPKLLDRGAARARAEGLDVTFQLADAEALPFEDSRFDAALSTFGVMFAPNHKAAASELLRVVRPGGRVALANWTPDGFIGGMFDVVKRFVPPPAGVASPMLWGDEPHIVSLFGDRARDIMTSHQVFNFRYQSASHFIACFRAWYGPIHKAFAALDRNGQDKLQIALEELIGKYDRGDRRGIVVPGEYLEIVVTRQ